METPQIQEQHIDMVVILLTGTLNPNNNNYKRPDFIKIIIFFFLRMLNWNDQLLLCLLHDIDYFCIQDSGIKGL